MNKREVLKGVGLGTAALGAAAIPAVADDDTVEVPYFGRSIRIPKQDWRDELLHYQNGWSIHQKNEQVIGDDGKVRTNISQFISISQDGIFDSERNWKPLDQYTILHWENIYIATDSDKLGQKRLDGDETTFNTLKEAYLYAKQLKEKHYG